jgi:DNA-binding transcriptional LysR family regulator
MELRHLRYFVAVADELHFGRAAARLHIAQPPLSQQIRQLEAELGFELFVRAHRRVALTEAGRAFLGDARGILARVEQAATSARRIASGEAGGLAVGFIASATYGLVPALLQEFRRRHPGVALSLSELSTEEQLAALRTGAIHLGLGRPPADAPSLVSEPLLDEPLELAMHATHPLARARTVPLRAIADESFILFPRLPRPGWADVVLGHCREAGFRPNVVHEAMELSTALAMVAAGVGVTLVAASVRTLHARGLVYRPLSPPAPTTRLLALYDRESAPPAVARFLEVARTVLAARARGPRRP